MLQVAASRVTDGLFIILTRAQPKKSFFFLYLKKPDRDLILSLELLYIPLCGANGALSSSGD